MDHTNLISLLKIIANQFIAGKDNIVIFGTGGSNLGARALINLLNGQYKKNIIFYDNIDPFQFNAIISKINFIDQSLVYGDNKPYLVALLVLNKEKKNISD